MGKDEFWERGGCRTRVPDLVLDCWWRGCFLTWLVVGSGAVPLPGFWGNWLSSPRAGIGLLMGGAGTQGVPGMVPAHWQTKLGSAPSPHQVFQLQCPGSSKSGVNPLVDGAGFWMLRGTRCPELILAWWYAEPGHEGSWR